MNAPAVSVIVPMFNAEKYIAECLESLLAQTLQNIEVILVNDCSTDSSRVIAESYLEKFGGRLTIYDNEKNSRAGASRNNGLRKACGEYVYFMDADDLILAGGLEKIYGIAEYFGVDFVNLNSHYDMSEDGKELTLKKLIMARLINEPILESNLEWRINKLLTWRLTSWAPWRKLIRREFLLENEIFFPENLAVDEDRPWTYSLLFQAKKIIHMPLAVYLYRQSDDSMTRKKRTPLQAVNLGINTIIQGLKWIEDIMDKVPFFEENPQYRYAVLENAVKIFFTLISKEIAKVSSAEMYLSIKEEFGKSFGEYENVVPVLFTMISGYRKIIVENKAQIAELKNRLK